MLVAGDSIMGALCLIRIVGYVIGSVGYFQEGGGGCIVGGMNCPLREVL